MSEYTPQFGWHDDPAEVARIVSMLPLPSFEAAAPLLKGSAAGKDVLFWEVEEKVLGLQIPPWDQGQVGSCVSHGWGRAVQDLLLIQIALGKAEEFDGEVAREPIYGGSRVEIGGQRGSRRDGSVGAWAAKWVSTYGILLAIKYANGVDLSSYSAQRCKDWGANGVPAELEQLAKQHPVKNVSAVTTPEGVDDAICNLYPVAVCGQTSRPMKRAPGGWCPKTGNNWPHCEEVCGACTVAGGSNSPWGGDGAFPYQGNVRALTERNSWGDYLGSANNQVQLASGRTITLPGGVYLSRYEDRAGDFRQGDTFTMTDANGYEARRIHWMI